MSDVTREDVADRPKRASICALPLDDIELHLLEFA